MHEGYLCVFRCNQCMTATLEIMFLRLPLAAKTTQTFLAISFFSNYLVMLTSLLPHCQCTLKKEN